MTCGDITYTRATTSDRTSSTEVTRYYILGYRLVVRHILYGVKLLPRTRVMRTPVRHVLLDGRGHIRVLRT